jgi:two-component system, NtrC family, nitrogen regulation sensor histidine kinase NtrY
MSPRRPLRHENAVLAFAFLAAAVPAAVALPLVWVADFELKTQITLTLAVVGGGLGFALAARSRVVRPLETLANLILSLRERDYSVRGRHRRRDDALGLALAELAALAGELRAERHHDEETAAGLARVVEGLDAAVVAFDRDGVVRLANPIAERLVGATTLVGRTADAVGLGAIAALDAPGTIELALAGGRTTWQVRPSAVRLSGVPHRLVVMTDVRRALRAEERQAWQRLVRVLGHEINNSLGPIGSIAETLRVALMRTPRAADLDVDLQRGLEVIERRAQALARFMAAYARLARLPPPRSGTVEVASWIDRVAALEQRHPVAVLGGPDVELAGDGDQLDQMLINLVANAIDAAAETGGGVRVKWSVAGERLELVVEDDGPGLADTANLFVPFFTTKAGGSGIGLVLARQIVEAHGGSLVVRNRTGARGCEAVVSLPGARAASDVAAAQVR